MYQKPTAILDLFERSPNVQRVFATLVVPPESEYFRQSFYPHMYNYVVSGDQLDYQLEKNSSIHYRQPVSAVDWLKYSRLSSPNLFLSVRIIESFASVHLLLISRGEFIEEVEETERFFNIPECVELPCPVRCDQPLRDRLVPTSVFDGLFIYTRAVRSLRVNDPSGFVRSHSSRPEHAWVTSAAWDNLMHFSLTTATVRPSGIYRYHSTDRKSVV